MPARWGLPPLHKQQTKLPDSCWDKPVSGLAWVISNTQHFWGTLSTAKQVYCISGCTSEVTLNTMSKLKYLTLCACSALLLKAYFRYNRHLVFSLSHKHDSNPRVTCTLWSSSQSGENVDWEATPFGWSLWHIVQIIWYLLLVSL